MAIFVVKCTFQKTHCMSISVTDQSVPSREVVSSIYVGSCEKHRISFVGKLQSLMLNNGVRIVVVVLETLNLFQFCSGQQWVKHSY
jgi:hypothetical protein